MQIKITGFGYSLVDGDHPLSLIIGAALLIVLLNVAACRMYGMVRGQREEEHED